MNKHSRIQYWQEQETNWKFKDQKEAIFATKQKLCSISGFPGIDTKKKKKILEVATIGVFFLQEMFPARHLLVRYFPMPLKGGIKAHYSILHIQLKLWRVGIMPCIQQYLSVDFTLLLFQHVH